MAKERLSRLQKWILVHTYLKTVKKQLPHGWGQPHGNFKDKKAVLLKAEVMTNFFKLVESPVRPGYFSTTGDNWQPHKKANVTYARSIANMYEKGLIYGHTIDAGKREIALTKAGKQKARELIKGAKPA